MTYYHCKFERERKANPTHWMIWPMGYATYRLVQIGGFNG